MSYIFPKRRLRKEDILDPRELNEDFSALTETFDAGLNEHNINERISSDIEPHLGNDPYYKVYSKWYASDPGIRGPVDGTVYVVPAHRTDSKFSSNAWNLPNDFQWHRVGSELDDFKLEFDSTTSDIWITAQFQYIWNEYHHYGRQHTPSGGEYLHTPSGGYQHNIPKNPASVQFALRVDGRVIEWTVTGKINPYGKTFWASKVIAGDYGDAEDTTYAQAGAGPMVTRRKQCGSLGRLCQPIRLGTIWPLGPGKHTVEVVARRIKGVTDDDWETANPREHIGSHDYITVYNRRLAFIEMPKMPAIVSADDRVLECPAFETEDLVSADSMAATVDVTRDVFNDLKGDSLHRGALNHEHLPSAVLAATQKDYAPSSARKLDRFYPGYDQSVFWVSGMDHGWTPIDYTSGTEWLSTGSLGANHGKFNTHDRNSVVVVMANVHVTELRGDVFDSHISTADYTNYFRSPCVWGHLCIAYRMEGEATWNVLKDTEVMFGRTWCDFREGSASDVGDPEKYLSLKAPEHWDIPLLWVGRSSSPMGEGSGIAEFAIFGSVSAAKEDGVSPMYTRPEMHYKASNITVFQLRVDNAQP
jgi:hypothetical protein